MTAETIAPKENEAENTIKLADCGGENKRKEGDSASENNSGEEEDAVRGRRQQPRRERSPVVLKRGVRGTVKWFSVHNGFGFIHREDTDSDIFVHASSIVRQTPARYPIVLSEQLAVEFDVVKGPKGLEAACVSGRDGKRVGTFCGYHQRFMVVRSRDRPFRSRSTGDMLLATAQLTEEAKQERADDDKENNDGNGKHQSPNKSKSNNRRPSHRRFRRNAPAKTVEKGEEEVEGKDDATTAKSGEAEDKQSEEGEGKAADH